MHNDLSEPHPYEPVSGRIIGLLISLACEQSHILLNWSVIISHQSTEDTIPNMNLKQPNVPSLTVHVYQNLLKCRQLRSHKQNTLWRQIQMREHGGSLEFNFILLPKTRGRQELCLPASSAHLGKMMPHIMFQPIQTLYEWHIYWTFPLFHARINFHLTIFVCSLYRS